MAIIVGYGEGTDENPIDRKVYAEGPFVIVNANGWRIEVDYGGVCPSFPDVTIYSMRYALGFKEVGKFHDVKAAERLCDALNQKVKEGEIVWQDNGNGQGFWYAPAYKEER